MVLLFVVCGWREETVAGVCQRTYLVHSTYVFFCTRGYERRKNRKSSWKKHVRLLSQPSFSFLFCAKTKKTVLTKIRLRMTWRNTSDLFSVPPGKLSYRFQTFRQSYLKRFSHIRRMRQNATKCDIALCRIDIAFCRILSHATNFVACDIAAHWCFIIVLPTLISNGILQHTFIPQRW
jgi:hypothetical protein